MPQYFFSDKRIIVSDMDTIRHSKWFDLAYKIGVGVKGFDGFVELATGLALLIAPGIVHATLSAVSGVAYHYSSHTAHIAATYVAHLDDDLAKSGLAFLIIFLIGHGVVKLVLVYCLLRRIIWAYPYALGVLVLFLVYQLYVLAQNPLSIGMWVFTILDVVIIWLVWGEWKDLKENAIISNDAKDTSLL